MNHRYSTFRHPIAAFTLVELLVVIGIIAALAALLLVGGRRAIITARQHSIQAEITQLDAAFIEYTNDISGGAYPPNVLWQNGIGSTGALRFSSVVSNFKRHFNKAFPKHREPEALLNALVGGPNMGGVVLVTPGSTDNDGLSPYEAVVFWLGGFSDDPKYPISGPGGPSFSIASGSLGEDFASRNKTFPFDPIQLGPKDDAGQFVGRHIIYTDHRSLSRRINLWVYFPANRTIPYAYFDASRRPVFDPSHDGLVPIKQLKVNPSLPPLLSDVRYANEGKCQILSAGLDDEWGDFASIMGVNYTGDMTQTHSGLLFPEGPFTAALADTITNFSTKATLEDSQP